MSVPTGAGNYPSGVTDNDAPRAPSHGIQCAGPRFSVDLREDRVIDSCAKLAGCIPILERKSPC